jgi:hypothetical protein
MILDLDRNALDAQAVDREDLRLGLGCDGKSTARSRSTPGVQIFFFCDHASPRQWPTNVREGRSQRGCRGGPEHSALVRRAPPQQDEQYHQSDDAGGYR